MMGYYFYYPPENKIFVAQYAKLFENGLISQEEIGSNVDHEVIQVKDAQLSENTSEHHNEVEHENVKPQSDIVPIPIQTINGSSRRRPIWMEMYTPIKLVLWQRDILKPAGFKMENSKRGSIPMQERLTLRKTQEPTKSILTKSKKYHWTAVKNILKYLKNTKDMFLIYGGVIDQKNAKQSTTAMSSTEAGYIVASKAAMEVIWIRKFVSGLRVIPTNEEPMKMKVHYIREVIKLGEINLLKVQTNDNLAGHFIKEMSCSKHTEHARSVGLRPASSLM
ncbi:hypothetical protein Tco_1294226 [Tanacetum coccineum]